ncbi:MAG: MafI family immunity protein, partial [Anaerolineales bacterium]|nr:MafI family immunity protein [Anaerolineales bacterium]
MNRFKKATQMILDLAKDFEGRLADHIIFDVRDYVDHNEPGIAFRILYAQLYEFY